MSEYTKERFNRWKEEMSELLSDIDEDIKIFLSFDDLHDPKKLTVEVERRLKEVFEIVDQT